jgi:hydrogenase maturation protease
MTARDVVVLGCGNPNRSDDGVGSAVIARLRTFSLPVGVRLFDCGTDGMTAMYRARGATHLVVVDARVPSGNPGAVFEVPGEMLAASPPRGVGLHEFRWDHALYAGRRIWGDAFPPSVTVLLVEAATLEFGLNLSPVVAAAAETVARRVATLAETWCLR